MESSNWRRNTCKWRKSCDVTGSKCHLPEGVRIHSDERIGEGVLRRFYIDERCQRLEHWYKDSMLLLINSRPGGPAIERFLDPCEARFDDEAVPVRHINLEASYFSMEKAKRRQNKDNEMYEQLTLRGLDEAYLVPNAFVEHYESPEPKREPKRGKELEELDREVALQLVLDFRSLEAVAYASL